MQKQEHMAEGELEDKDVTPMEGVEFYSFEPPWRWSTYSVFKQDAERRNQHRNVVGTQNAVSTPIPTPMSIPIRSDRFSHLQRK